MKRFHGICLITPEIARLRRFYCDVLQVDAEGDEQFAAVTTVGATLTFYTEQGMEQLAPRSMQDAGRGGCTLEFEVADVDAEYARLLTLGIPIVKPPMTHPWGMRSVWFRDPDGNLIDFFAKVQRNGDSLEGVIT